jgi:hypothetical protein
MVGFAATFAVCCRWNDDGEGAWRGIDHGDG